METCDTTFSLIVFNWAMDLKEAADSYAKATAEFLKVAQELSEAELDSSSSGGWTARQVIHHVADSEAQSYARLRRLIAEPGTQIQGYDEGRWGEDETTQSRIGLKLIHDIPQNMRLKSDPAYRANLLFPKV